VSPDSNTVVEAAVFVPLILLGVSRAGAYRTAQSQT
jgi:hypothetical protein